ncbi:MAG TPA: SAM-dependent methyltransferase [Actinoplanes sp.]|nr:SAM-dependent methyltransferase [Actinoplanes sp.]
MENALYREGGFFVRANDGPADHFRTSVHASPLFAGAMMRLMREVDEALDHPRHLDVVDVGAGRGELLTTLTALLGDEAQRIRFTGVDLAARPAGLDPRITWRRDVPDGVVGLLLATEWLDNVPLDVAELDDHGRLRQVLVDPPTGAETLGGPPDAADLAWLSRWADLREPGDRAEIGRPRDVAWAGAVAKVRRGCALAVDYGHLRDHRPPHGTLTGFRGGRQVPPVPDGSCDITAHVAMDSAAGAAGTPYRLTSQRTALKALGVDGARPPLDLARTDPPAYLRALSAASAAAELIDPAGLGGHWWLLHTLGTGHRGSMVG